MFRYTHPEHIAMRADTIIRACNHRRLPKQITPGRIRRRLLDPRHAATTDPAVATLAQGTIARMPAL
jgi:hypothetical protein